MSKKENQSGRQTVVNYGLYGESYEPRLPGFVHSELHETRCQQHGWVIRPHMHTNLFQIVLIDSGSAEFTHHTETAQLTEPCLITVPADVLHGYLFSQDVKGLIISLSDEYVGKLFPESPGVLLELSRMHLIRQSTDPAAFRQLSELAWQIHTELYADRPERGLALQSYIGLLLIAVYRLGEQRLQDELAVDNRNVRYFRQFQQLLKENRTADVPINPLSISAYARRLGITSVHLNRVCRSVAGLSTLQLIQDELLLEAKRYLHHSSYSIAEIAYLLQFEDASYFSRLFRKKTGLSPKQFREQQRTTSPAGIDGESDKTNIDKSSITELARLES
ncbi:helix-turn-helix domain-containing protein [Spirosoma rhododendri]|uniref:Helix-turn-helix domain-containing protein n=1 Tax=Spirosoma rhododendri TaxID=2728024 RepID=A0A7L5DND9_9BACT|nr:helix-turn-helix domain-containing protein [Spirosoma rhododendri]QJD79979.1 helix-turn-helix domain-containing protein [Spirosoma rhododendri]